MKEELIYIYNELSIAKIVVVATIFNIVVMILAVILLWKVEL